MYGNCKLIENTLYGAEEKAPEEVYGLFLSST